MSTVGGETNGSTAVGGLVGNNTATLTDATADIIVTGENRVGGLVGVTTGEVTAATASGSVTDSGDAVGGLVGYVGGGGEINRSTATGSVSANNDVGGLVGNHTSGLVTLSYANGTVTGNETNVGGLIGNNSAIINQSYAVADVAGDSTNLGGLVGYNTDSAEINETYAAGSVSDSGSPTGGLVAAGSEDSIDNSYWDNQTTGQTDSAGGAALSTFQMQGAKAESQMAFDFSGTWNVTKQTGEGNRVSYPFLRENEQEPNPGTQRLYAAGDGSKNSPYEIENWVHLDNVRQNPAANFTVVGDLDNETKGYGGRVDMENGFDPIGEPGDEFTGTFDGGSQNISDLTVNRSGQDNVGLFGVVEDGDLENIHLRNATITGANATGGIAGTTNADATIRNSTANGKIEGATAVGGLTGDNAGTVTGSYGTANVTGDESVGGLVGENRGSVSEAYATGTVDGNLSVGGLIGLNEGGNATQTFATGTVGDAPDKDAVNAGGLVGNNTGNVTESYWDTESTNKTTGINVTSGQTNEATGLTTEEMTGLKAPVYMTAFDVEAEWRIGTAAADEEYPDLPWESEYDDGADAIDAYLDGHGDSNKPYKITDSYELQATTYNTGADYELTSDINATNTTEWPNGNGFDPVGDSGDPFTGTLDGNGNTLSNLTIDRAETDSVGLFGVVNGDSENTKIEALTLTNTSVTGNNETGALVGVLKDGSVTGVTVDDTDSVVNGSDNVGGLIGHVEADGSVSDATTSAEVNGEMGVGGLVGDSAGSVSGSAATASVNGTTKVGGLVGTADSEITDSSAGGSVNGSTAVGGLVGVSSDDVIGSNSSGDVNGTDRVGGLIGENAATVTESTSTSTVTGDGTAVGGLVGESSGEVNKSYARGRVDGGTDATSVGGLVGNNNGTIANTNVSATVNGTDTVGGLVGTNADAGEINTSFVTGEINQTGDEIGGLVGKNSNGATVNDAYWDRSATNESDAIGNDDGDSSGVVGLSETDSAAPATEMQQFAPLANMDGLDYTDDQVWIITDEYPELAWTSPDRLLVDDVAAENVTETAGETGQIVLNATLANSDGTGEGVRINITDSDDLNTLNTSNVTNTSSSAVFDFNETTAGTYTVGFNWSDEGLNDGDTVNNETTVTIEPAAAANVSVVDAPDTLTGNESLNLTLEVTDAFGNPVPDATVNDLTIDSEFDGEVRNTTNTTDADGNMTVEIGSNNITTANDTHTLTVTGTVNGNALSDGTVDIDVGPADADTVELLSQPDTEQTAGETIDPTIDLNLTDEFGNPVPNNTLTVSLNDSTTLTGDTAVDTNESGIAEFDDLNVTDAGSYTLNVTLDEDSSVNVTSDAFDVTAAEAAQTTIETQPTDTTAGEMISASQINVTDAFDNIVAGENVTVSVNGSASLAGTTEVETSSSGIADFDDLNITEAGTYELTYQLADDDSVSVTSQPFVITAAEPADATIETQPEAAAAGDAIGGPPAANITDEFDNAVIDETVTVSANGSADLNGATEVETDASGIAEFSAINISDTGSYNLTFEVDEHESVNATSDAFDITALGAAQTTIETQPADTDAGTTISASQINVTDEFDNSVTGENVTVSVNGSASLAGTTEVETNSSGIADFDALSIETAGIYELTYELADDDSVNVTSQSFEITAAAATDATIETQPETAATGGDIGGPPAVNITDEFNNAVIDENVTVTVNGTANLGGKTDRATNESGIVEFDDLNITEAGSYTLTFELNNDESVTATTAPFGITTNTPSTVTVTQNRESFNISTNFQDNNTLVANVSVVDTFGNNVSNTFVNLTDTGEDIAVEGSRNKTTDATGNVSFAIQSETPQDNVEFVFTAAETGENDTITADFTDIQLEANGTASSSTVAVGSNVTFRAGGSTVPNGSIPTYEWEWGLNGKTFTGTGETNTTSFTTSGTVEPTLNVTVANRTVSQELPNITVFDATAPQAKITAKETVSVGVDPEFDASNTTDNAADAADLEYAWDFGNGTTAIGTGLTRPTGNYSTPGVYDVELTVTDGSGNSDSNATTVLIEGSNATLPSGTVNFDTIGVNSTTLDTLSIRNRGTTDLNVSNTTITGENASVFGIRGDSEPVVGPGETTTLVIGFEPSSVGQQDATLNIETNATVGANSSTVELTGSGEATNISPTTNGVDIGTTTVGTTVEAAVTFDNDGPDAATITSATVAGADADQFSVEELPPSISTSGTGDITVAFQPDTHGEQTATLVVETSDGQTARTAINATGVGPSISLGEGAISFGTVGINSSDIVNRSVSISNEGNRPLAINKSETAITGANASVFDIELPKTTLAAGETIDATLNFSDLDAKGEYEATLEVAHNDTTQGELSTVSLSGTGEGAFLSIGTLNINFGDVPAGQTVSENVTIENLGRSDANLTIQNSTITGTDAENFEIADVPDEQIPPGTERDITVNLTTTEDDQTAQLVIESDSENQQRTYVFLSSSEAFINVREESESNVSVVGGNLPGGNYYDVDVALPSTETSNVTVESVGTEINNESFETDIQNSETAFNNSLTPNSGEDLVQYVQLDHKDHDASQTFDNTSLAYTIDASAVPADTDPSEITLHRYNTTTDSWTKMTVERSEDRGDSIYFEVDTPGFSEFAVTAPEEGDSEEDDSEEDDAGSSGSSGSGQTAPPPVEERRTVSVSDPVIDDTELTTGESTTVRVTLENSGNFQEEVTVNLVANGETVTTQTVTVDDSSSTEVAIPFESVTAGEYTLTVGGETVGTVSVIERNSGENNTNEPDRTDTDGPDRVDAEDSCELFGVDYGSFIVCWYWWLLAASLGLSLVLYQLWSRDMLRCLVRNRDNSQRQDNTGETDE